MADYTTDRRIWRFVGRGVLAGLVVGALALVVNAVGDLQQPSLLALSVPVVIAVIVQLVRLGVADVLPPTAVEEPESSTPEYFVGLRQLERRLEASSREVADFDWLLRPVLAELAAERLSNRHGILYTSQPTRAREIVGDELWEIMRPPADQPIRAINRRRVEDLIGRIEQI